MRLKLYELSICMVSDVSCALYEVVNVLVEWTRQRDFNLLTGHYWIQFQTIRINSPSGNFPHQKFGISWGENCPGGNRPDLNRLGEIVLMGNVYQGTAYQGTAPGEGESCSVIVTLCFTISRGIC